MKNSIDYKACLSKTIEYGEKNDCSVKAVAIVLNTSYEDAHQLMKEHGRKDGRGLETYKIINALKSRGFEVKKLEIGRYTKNRMSVQRFEYLYLHKNYFKNPVLIFTGGHVAAVRDNKVQDYTTGSYKHVQYAYEIIPTADSVYTKETENIKVKVKIRKAEKYKFALVHKETKQIYIKYKRKPSLRVRFAVTNNDLWIAGKKEETKGKLEIIEL